MMTHLSLKFDTRQSQGLTPRLQYAVRLLQLSSQDYENELHEMVEKNPFLEVEEAVPARTFLAEGISLISLDAEPPERSAVSEAATAAEHEAGEAPSDNWLASTGAGPKEPLDAPASALDRMVDDIGLHPYLRSQMNLLALSERDRALVCAVIESLDDDGYLRLELAEIADMADLEPPTDACEMRMALKLVQSFEPEGVGARTLAECLLLQIEPLQSAQGDLMRRIVTDHLDRLAQRDVVGLARLLKRPVAEVQWACEAVRRLDPRPGWRFGKSDVPFITPDVVASKTRGQWAVQLNPAIVPQLKFNHVYAGLFHQHREAQHGELGAYLQEARWAMRNVEQRFSTILAVARAIVRRQSGFFEHGPLAMKPLALREIAEEVGVHESTVCRVTHNKYMATPGRLIELKQFFSRPLPTTGGATCSPMAIRGLVQEIIAAEDPARPLSDVEIAQRLARQGLTVVRRTVTKYRNQLKLPAAEHRHPQDG